MAGEEIILSGSEETLKPIISLLVGFYQLIENRDICDIVGIPLVDSIRADVQTIKLTVFFSPSKEPPFRNKPGKPQLKPYCNVSDIDIRKLTWENIKRAAGGENGYNWGRFRATANLSNKRQMQVYGGSEKEAEERLLALNELSKAKIITLTVSEEKKIGRKAAGKLLYKETTRIYPTYFTLVNNEKVLIESEREIAEAGVRGKLDGNFKRKQTPKIPLWTTKEPPTTKEAIREALRVRGSGSAD